MAPLDPRAKMRRMVTHLTDSALDMELAFAEGFDLQDEAAKAWLEELRAEKQRRAWATP